MQKATTKAGAGDLDAQHKLSGFNYNKLQAVLCISASAVVSISLIIWGISKLA